MINLTFAAGSALVAGGTGNVGTGVVTRLARAGLPVTFTYRSKDDAARELAGRLAEEGLRVRAVPMVAGDPGSVASAIAAAEEFGGPLRHVAWTVGGTVPFNRIADFAIDQITDFLTADVIACCRFLHDIVPVLRRNGGGTITAATTIATQRVIAYDGISPFAKGAVQALLRQLAAEEGDHGIRVNDVAIGVIFDLPLEELAAHSAAAEDTEGRRMNAMFNQLVGLRRLNRHGRPDDAGNLFAFLASEQAAFITGQRIALDGGMTL